jgi:hypothetical protein
MIDGKRTNVHGLKVGTIITATYTTTTTPVTDRTVSNLAGTVWFVSGTTVILTLPDGTNKMYKSLPGYKFTVDGRPDADVSSLRKGMRIAAEKIEEEPGTIITNNPKNHGIGPQTLRGPGSIKGPYPRSGPNRRSGPTGRDTGSRTSSSPGGRSCSGIGGASNPCQAPQNGQYASFGRHAGPAFHGGWFRSSHGASSLTAKRRA